MFGEESGIALQFPRATVESRERRRRREKVDFGRGVITRWRQTPTLEAGRREGFFFLFFLPHLTCEKLIAGGCLLPRPSLTRLLSISRSGVGSGFRDSV